MYKIKPEYIHRENPLPFDDTPNTDKWQYEVYELAHTISLIIPKLPILDIGCGSGYKLVNIFKDFDTLGIELPETYIFLIETYPKHKWKIKSENPPKKKFGIVILSDVIEHIKNPNEMLEYISKINFKYLIISTPNRDDITLSQDGPPNNIAHAREWNFKEFEEYISEYFDVINHYDINKNQKTQCIICKKLKIN
jgi:2-polyprenyl-3-methyl-5-hydroxy-6-metoxy-1,4-benzoquinol methylase